MMQLAHGRLSGLALYGPALFFLMLASFLLSACRQQVDEQLYQGAALGTGYHITLYADLGAEHAAEIEAGIQGELANLEAQREVLIRASVAALAPLWVAPSAALQHELDRRFHALAVDRLTLWLGHHAASPVAVLVEVGGVMRGFGTPPAGAWRLSLEQPGLPVPEGARHVRLQDAALVHRFVQQEAAAPLVTPATPLSVSVIAADAGTAIREASLLIHAGPEEAIRLADELDSAAKVVVKRAQGIEIHHTAALEPWLVR